MTGETWIDGKPIYRKVFKDITLPTCTTDGIASEKTVVTNTQADELITLHYKVVNKISNEKWQAVYCQNQ